MKHLSGKKLGRHSSYIEAAEPLIIFLNSIPSVKKISFGEIKTGLKSAPQRMKINIQKGGLEITVRGTISLQKIHVYSQDSEVLKKIIEERFDKS